MIHLSPSDLCVTYTDRIRFQTDFQQYLRNRSLFIPATVNRPSQGTHLDVRLVLPSGMDIRCTGDVVVCLPTGYGISLVISDDDYKALSGAFHF